MASTVLYRSLQAPTAVSAACCISTPDGHAVLQLQDTRLTCWRVSGDGLEQTASWRAPASMLQMVHLPGNYLLLLVEGGHCYLHSWQDQHAAAGAAAPPLVAHAQLQVPIDSSVSHVQPYGCVVSRNALSAPVGQAVASLVAVAYMPGVLHVIKASPFIADNSSAQGASSSTAAASTPAAGTMILQVKAMALTHTLLSCHYPGGEPPALASVRVSCRMLDMAWLSPAEQQLDMQGRSLLAVLHEMTVGSQPPVRHVDCVAVNWAEETISPGPWSLRNVHPTAQLLQPFAGSEHLPPGILAISSRGVQLCTCLGSKLQQQQRQQRMDSTPQAAAASSSSGQQASAGEPGPSSHLLANGLFVNMAEVVQWGLNGLPSSCVPLSDSCYLVGDSRAGLYMFSLGQGGSKPAAAWVRLQPSSCLTVPDVLLHAPLPQQQQQHPQSDLEQHGQQQLSGLLLVGGKCSSSQVLGLTQAVAEAAASKPWPSQQQQFVLPVLQSALQPSIAGAQAVAVYQDPSGGLPEQQLLVACGVAPRGKLAIVRSGCGLMPAMLDGPELPGDSDLFAISQPQPCQHKQPQQQGHVPQQCPDQHSMLGFSFPSAGASSAMSLEGQTFRQLQLTGLSHGEASLLMATAPGGWLVQVTPSGVRLLDASAGWQLCSQWAPAGGSISLAAAHGSSLVVACGAQLTMLTISCCSGTVAVTATAELQQQASALSIFTLQGGQLMVAAGLWVDNTILLMTCPAQPDSSAAMQQPHQQQQGPAQLQVACCVDLQADQPRSLAVLPVGAADVLLVGSNTGKVLLWEICSSTRQEQDTAQQTVSLQHARAVQISNTSVSLQQAWLPDIQPGAQHNSSSTSSTSCQSPVVRCVVAHAGSMAVLRPNTALLEALQGYANTSTPHATPAAGVTGLGHVSATACVAVSRLCGSEACLGAASVHTSDMPYSLAWVSNTQQLCFGSIEAEHKLRWRSCGLLGTPLAVAVHQRSDTIVLLLAADEYAAVEQDRQVGGSDGDPTQQDKQQQCAQQRLVVLDGRSLQVLMSLALAPGHIYTTLQVLDLPATSQQQQHATSVSDPGSQRATGSTGGGVAAAGSSESSHAHGQQQQQERRPKQQQEAAGSAPGCLPFIVLGSNVVLATADSGPAASSNTAAGEMPLPRVKRLGVLSFFELRKSVVQAATAGAGQLAGQSAARSELRYELVLHGMVPLQVTPSSACTVVPELLEHTKRQQAGSQHAAADVQQAAGDGGSSRMSKPGKGAAAAAAAKMPLLVVGSERGLTLLRVVVDDLALAEQQRLEAQLAQIGKVPAGNAAACAAAMMAARATAAEPPAAEQSMQSSSARQCGRLSLQELSSTAPMNQGVVTKLSSSGSCVVALESLGSVTAFRALCVQPGGWVQLMSVANAGMDSGKLIAADFAMQPAAPLNLACADAGRTSAAGGAREPAGARASGASSRAAAPQQEQEHEAAAAAAVPQNQAILVATHPAGLLLLQRDLQDEGRHVSSLIQAAQAAWEAGNRPDEFIVSRTGILMAEPAARAQPWQGAGEVAPWAGLDAAAQRQLQGLREDLQRLAGHADMQGQARQVLAAEAAAAAGVSGPMGDVRPDWLAFVNVRPGLAPAMIPSASCAPVPGSMLLCQARLGLHPEAVSATEGGEGAPGGGASSSLQDGTCSASSTVLCLSASGGVATAQLLPPEQGRMLLDWQQHAMLDSGAAGQLMEWGAQDSAGGCNGGSTVAAGSLAESSLRGLLAPDAVASYEGYDRAPGALANCMAGKLVLRTGQGSTAGVQGLDQGQQEASTKPFGVVDGDLLFKGAQMGDGSEGMGMAGDLQHRLWQDVL